MKLKGPSPAMIIACIALVAALSGGAYAAKKIKKLPKNIVSSKSIKNGAVTEKKIKNKAVTDAKLAPGAGGAAAYARVTNPSGTPTVDATNTKNVIVKPATTPATGKVCVDSTATIKSVQVTPETLTTATDTVLAEAIVNPDAATCPAGSDALVITKDASGAAVDADFYVTLFS